MSPDNATATSLNPSALGSLDSWSLTYSHVAAAERSAYPDRFDGAWVAAPLGAGLALGTGMEFSRARDGSDGGANAYVLGAALRPSPSWSLGTSWRMRAPRPGGEHVSVADLALTVRPAPLLAISLIGRDLAPHTPSLGLRPVRESGTLAIAVRPLADDRLMLELAGRSDVEGELGLRMAAQALIPWVGRIGLAGELSEVASQHVWTVQAGIDVRWGRVSVAPAVHLGDGADDVGWSVLADLHGTPRIGVPAPRYLAKLELRDVGPRRLIGLVRTLERAVHDPRVAGVVLAPEGAVSGLATAQEIRLLVEALERAGKPVYCYLQSATGAEYYLCAGAKRIAIDPAGMVRLLGVGGDSLYYGDLLRQLGVNADFVRIGRYKGAPEQYTNAGPSEATREVRGALLDAAYGRLVGDLAHDLGRDPDAVRAIIDQGPILAEQAVSTRLAAAAIDRHDLEKDLRTMMGQRLPLRAPELPARHPRFGPTGQIGVVVIDGTMVDGSNVDVPIINIHMSGGRTVSEAIDRLADDTRIRAIVLRIDSPGGAVMASDQIWRAVRRARAKKPVIASLGDVAASGGYYVASAANEIWATPSSITGSIGIFYGKVDVAPLARRFGIGIETDTRGAHAGGESLFRPFRDEERAALADKLRVWYRQFLGRVAEGRSMPLERVDELGRGRVYSGEQAHKLGLVDSLGGFAAALERARTLGGLGPEAELVVVPQVPDSLLEFVTGVGVRAQERAESAASLIPPPVRALLQRVYPWMWISPSEAMALYEGPLRLE